MRRILFLLVLGLGLIYYANAQVIELIGKGVYGDNISTLTIPNPATVQKVVVVAAATFYGDPSPSDVIPQDVTFTTLGVSDDVSFTKISDPMILTPVSSVLSKIASGENKYGYYTKEYTSVGNSIELNSNGQQESVKSFVAYITRMGPSPSVYSEVKGEYAFAFHNGEAGAQEYTFTIPESDSPREVIVTVPFTDLESADDRPANLKIEAGGLSKSVEFETNNAGDLLHIEPVTLPDVPGGVTEVTVIVYSKTLAEAGDALGGDSFVTGPALLSTTYEERDPGCTLTWGYWKTHSEKYGPAAHPDDTWNLILGPPSGPDAPFFISGQTYMEVLNTAVKGNAYYILAHQYIAAELNMLAGADISDAQPEFDNASTLLAAWTPAQVKDLKGNDADRKMFVDLGETLDSLNMGEIGPGHCDDLEDLKSAEIARDKIVDFTVYPNPVRNTATISFVPRSTGVASVELYNSVGQRMGILYHMNVRENVGVDAEIDVQAYKEGLYILRFRNNTDVISKKIRISN